MGEFLSDKVLAFTGENALISPPCHVLVAVSGGADSMALLHLMSHWPEDGVRVSAIHIHHGLRESADRDEAFVRDYCARSSIPLTIVREDVSAVAQRENFTLEEAGRRVRYAHFEAVRRDVGADLVLTAHTASDQMETMLMRIVRGCGLDGLCGIPSARGNIRRPLLCCTREEVEVYCAANDLSYVEDETNADVRYMRNFVRHRVVPQLKEMNPSVTDAFLRLRENAETDAAYLNGIANDALINARFDNGYARDAFLRHPSVIRRRMIRTLCSDAGLPVFEECHIVAAEQAVLNGGSVSFPNGWVFAIEQDVVYLYETPNDVTPEETEVGEIPTEISFGNRTMRILSNCSPDDEWKNIYNLLSNSAIDYDKVKGKLRLRCRRTGDYMHPSGRGVGKSLKKLMNEWRIPSHLRDTYPLLCDEDGVILVPRYACDQRVSITENTKHYLVCTEVDV